MLNIFANYEKRGGGVEVNKRHRDARPLGTIDCYLSTHQESDGTVTKVT